MKKINKTIMEITTEMKANRYEVRITDDTMEEEQSNNQEILTGHQKWKTINRSKKIGRISGVFDFCNPEKAFAAQGRI